MGISVTILNDSVFANWVAAAMFTGELYMTGGVREMVADILAHLRVRPRPSSLMSRLNILDHGVLDEDEGTWGVRCGWDRVGTANFAKFEPDLARLRGWFDLHGFAHLQHCKAGLNIRLLEMFADTFGVPIVAGRGLQHPVLQLNWTLQWNWDNYVRVFPATALGARRASDMFYWGP